MNMREMMFQPFWMVLNEASAHTQYRHDTEDRAIIEAKRLAAANKGTKFYVLCAVGYAEVYDPVTYVAAATLPF